jgi:hypothetical protein
MVESENSNLSLEIEPRLASDARRRRPPGDQCSIPGSSFFRDLFLEKSLALCALSVQCLDLVQVFRSSLRAVGVCYVGVCDVCNV